MSDGKKSIEKQIEIDASPEDVWRAVSTSEGLTRWFPLEAKVEPGPDGSVTLSWGPGVTGTARVGHWEEGKRISWIESYGEEVEITVDFYVEGKDGHTVFRVVQSGFSSGEEWADYLDTVDSGWRYFLFNLKHYLERHAGRARTMVWRRVKIESDRQECWNRLTAGETLSSALGSEQAAVVQEKPAIHWAALIPEMDDALLFLELEPGSPSFHLGIWLSLYEPAPGVAEQAGQQVDAWLSRHLPSSP